MIQPTKQALRDEIVTLTMRNGTHEIRERQLKESAVVWKTVADGLDQSRVDNEAEARRATIAAYALLATLVVIVVWEVIL